MPRPLTSAVCNERLKTNRDFEARSDDRVARLYCERRPEIFSK